MFYNSSNYLNGPCTNFERFMELTFAQMSSVGPVRPKNEDYLGFWHPDGAEELRDRGVLMILADGLGGHGHGEIASRLAVETALKVFLEASSETPPEQALRQMFQAANVAVHEAGRNMGGSRMGTTLTATIFGHHEIHIGHAGDSRVYLVHEGSIRQLSTDHSYVGMQLKLGLISEQEAMTSPLRTILTRSIGPQASVPVDVYREPVHRGDIVVQCSDGLHSFVTAKEVLEIVTNQPPDEACRQLFALAEKHGTDDNLSVQVARVERLENAPVVQLGR